MWTTENRPRYNRDQLVMAGMVVLQTAILRWFGWTHDFLRVVVGLGSLLVNLVGMYWVLRALKWSVEREHPQIVVEPVQHDEKSQTKLTFTFLPFNILDSSEFLPNAKTMKMRDPNKFLEHDRRIRENAKSQEDSIASQHL